MLNSAALQYDGRHEERPDVKIDPSEMEFTFSRSSGAGGQNVNKVNSRVTLRWNIEDSPSIADGIKQRFYQRYGNRITATGDVLIHSDRSRDQKKNLDDCVEKLEEMLQSVATPPRKRVKTKPTRSSVARRLDSKKKNADRKSGRRKIHFDD